MQKKNNLKQLSLRDLIYYHALSHAKYIDILHNNMVDELLDRGYSHYTGLEEIKGSTEGVNKLEDIEYITLEEIAERLPVNISITEKPYICYLHLGLEQFNKVPKGGTIRFVFNQEEDKRLIKAIKSLENDLPIKTYVQFGLSTIGSMVPIFRYGLFKTSKEERGIISDTKYKKYNLSEYNDLYYNWISNSLDKGILIGKSVNGRSFSISKKKDKITITIDDKDRTSMYPNVIDEVSNIKGDFVIKGEVSGYNTRGKKIISAELKGICESLSRNNSRWIVDGSITPEQELYIVFHAYDLTYLNECIADKPYIDRVNELNKFIPDNLEFIEKISFNTINTLEELNSNLDNYIKSKNKEIMLVISDSKYPMGKSDIAKLRLTDGSIPTIELNECPYYKDSTICTFLSSFSKTCSISNVYDCTFK